MRDLRVVRPIPAVELNVPHAQNELAPVHVGGRFTGELVTHNIRLRMKKERGYGMRQDGMEWGGTGWDEMRWGRMGSSGIDWDRIGSDGMIWDGMGWNWMRLDEMGLDGATWD